MPIIYDALLKDYAYYKTGGACRVLYVPTSVSELAEAVRDVRKANLPLMRLGGGTNSLVMDDPFDGAVIVFKNLRELRRKGADLFVGGGTENSEVAQFACDEGLGGAAWMYRLPGQLGGTIRMNARCYGGEISQITTNVTVVSPLGEVRDVSGSGVFRGYKDTVFMTSGDLIAGARLSLVEGADPTKLMQKMQACAADRASKGQFDWPSCGCVFKNDYAIGAPSGMLLESAGAKGLKHQGAEVSEHHANFVFNKGASSRAILELTIRMRELVYQEFGAWLEYEMEILGRLPKDLAPLIAAKRPVNLKIDRLQPLREKLAARNT